MPVAVNIQGTHNNIRTNFLPQQNIIPFIIFNSLKGILRLPGFQTSCDFRLFFLNKVQQRGLRLCTLGVRWDCFLPDFGRFRATYISLLDFDCLVCKMTMKKQMNKPNFVSSSLLYFSYFTASLFLPSFVRLHKIMYIKYLTCSMKYVYICVYIRIYVYICVYTYIYPIYIGKLHLYMYISVINLFLLIQ